MTIKCPKCGMENDDMNDVCKSCGSVLFSTNSSSQPKEKAPTKDVRYTSLKQYSLAVGDEDEVKKIRVAHVVLYIIGILNIILVLILKNLDYDGFVSDDLSFIDGFLILAMAIWLHLSYSPIAAIFAFLLMLAETLYSLIGFREIPWLSVVACVDCAIAIAKTSDLSRNFKYYKKRLASEALNGNQSAVQSKESQTEKLREEKLKLITLKEGYQFASIPSRIFAEKTDVPGSYCCPYCYAEVSSDVSSMCANCGKSLGVEAAVVPAPASQVQPIVNETFEKSTEAPAASSVVEKKSVLKNKKVLIGAGIGAAAIAVVVLVVVLIANYGPSNSEYNRLAEKLERLEKEAAEKAVSDNVQSKVEGNVPDEYDGLAVGMVLRSDSNLRLRSSENTDSSIITTMNAHTKVKILRIGRADESEGVESNWVLVEILPGGKDRDGKRIPDGTAGWCFGGFLEPCPED